MAVVQGAARRWATDLLLILSLSFSSVVRPKRTVDVNYAPSHTHTHTHTRTLLHTESALWSRPLSLTKHLAGTVAARLWPHAFLPLPLIRNWHLQHTHAHTHTHTRTHALCTRHTSSTLQSYLSRKRDCENIFILPLVLPVECGYLSAAPQRAQSQSFRVFY